MARVDSIRMRAGQLFCACDSDGLPLSAGQRLTSVSTNRMSAAFGLAILAQILTLSSLPLASASIAPQADSVAWPYLALLGGAAIASFPASLLLDVFGRRAAFALGASLGLAGGAIAAWAVLERQFIALLIGVAWLGIAQGFGLFYRHAGAAGGRSGQIFAGGLGAAVLGPVLLGLIDNQFGPFAPAFGLLAAGLANLAMLGLAVTLPSSTIEIEAEPLAAPPARVFYLATLTAGLAWLSMTGIMASAPLLMAGCGIGFSASALAMAMHLMAMYLPGFVIGRWIALWGGFKVALTGLGFLIVGIVSLWFQNTAAGFSLTLLFAGIGWGITTIGATAWLHQSGHPTPLQLAMHDGSLFLAAMAGAFTLSRLV